MIYTGTAYGTHTVLVRYMISYIYRPINPKYQKYTTHNTSTVSRSSNVQTRRHSQTSLFLTRLRDGCMCLQPLQKYSSIFCPPCTRDRGGRPPSGWARATGPRTPAWCARFTPRAPARYKLDALRAYMHPQRLTSRGGVGRPSVVRYARRDRRPAPLGGCG